MTTLEAIILGIVQGITEFLPVSSSGHLKLAQHLFGYQQLDNLILFDMVCHLGTLCAILFFFFKSLKIITLHKRSLLYALAIGTLPLFPVALFLGPIKRLYDTPQLLGFFFLCTAFLLHLGPRLAKQFQEKKAHPTKKDALIIGVFQAFATLPGVSRSGATLSASLGLGIKRENAFLFSFMLAIPATLGGITLLLLEMALSSSAGASSVGYLQYALGFGTSLGVGVLALKAVERLVASEKTSIFVWYCLLLGASVLIVTSGPHVEEKETKKLESIHSSGKSPS